MDNKIEKDVLKKSFTQIFSYQLDEVNKDARYNAYLVPLRWFVKLYTRRTHKITMGDIAMQMGIDLATFSKMLHHGVAKDNRRITAEHINRICEIIDIPLSSILFLYEYKEDVEKKLWRDDFEKLTNLLRGNFDEILYPAIFYDINSGKKVSKPANTKDSTSSLVSKNSILEPIRGKWYFYFPSSDSEIKNQREKTLKKNPNHVPESPELAELFDLYLPDHIYCGIVNIESKNGEYYAVLKYMTNPSKHRILCYEGSVSSPVDNTSIFCSLTNQRNGDIMYIIMSKPSAEMRLQYLMASVLTLSHHQDEEKHRPCSLRMVLSRRPIEFDSKAYKVMISNLMMNEAVISIDDYGYSQLKEKQKEYDSSALDYFLEKYPTIDSLPRITKRLTVRDCAYINEKFLDSFEDSFEEIDILYLEALLRRHSTALWYSKTKATKINKVLKKISAKNISFKKKGLSGNQCQ
ncbi:helix-turn-helix transcriptional regulator [Dorea sp. YH-dor228]|uniref:helix-turn-helix domain-containing protein n=1 Tax=Dorea sp. YH-dor228 TaxID=3151120 RepID=UPI003048BF5F|nr:helix-turn-helix transcriptional regulator [Lachnospiraceae bacterium]